MDPSAEAVNGNESALKDANEIKPSVPSDDHINIHESISQGVKTQLKVTNEGTLDVDLDDERSNLSKLLKPVLDHHVGKDNIAAAGDSSQELPKTFTEAPTAMNIVIFIVGSRGDVQPFISLGKVLQDQYSHRVRIATHITFKSFVEQNGLEFFNIGGDPTELMAYMVKNPGLMPDLHTIKSGDIGKRRQTIYEILNGCWRSCVEPGDGTDSDSQIGRYNYQDKPFIADAIIANPPSFAHVHCAEKLGIPLHMMFTMPWSPTQSFPHPLVNIKSSNADRDMTNYISYTLVDMMTWQGLGDVINKFRNRALNLGPVSVMWAPGMTHRLRIPFTYCWSPALIPKPTDWGHHISISGFYFLSLASNYTPDPALLKFLNAGPPPVYIGFGSIVVDDPDAMTALIFKAVKLAGIRALVSKGWGGLGADGKEKIPEDIFMLGNIPHDYLFQHVSAVVHHGGAGTTAAGVLAGKPTVVVPFFGDQPFWGSMIARAGAGPEPIPYKHLTAELLSQQIKIALRPETVEKAKILSKEMRAETGADLGAKYFHESLTANMQCSVLPGRVAVWRVKKTNMLLSAMAAVVLKKKGLVDMHDLKLHRSQEYETEDGPWDPVSGIASVLLGTLSTLVVGASEIPSDVFHALKTKMNSRHNSINKDGSSDANSITSDRKLSESNTTLSSGSPQIVPKKESESPKDAAAMLGASPDTPEEVLLSKEVSISSDSSSIAPHEKKHNHSLHDHLNHAKEVASHVAEVGLSVPMDLANSLAQGFHNVPKIYQDKTVRPQENVTGMRSGLQAAGKEFTHGIYDGVTGVITQPFQGAREEGAVGFVKGVGKGIGGLVLKPTAALFSVPADTIKGAYKELRKTGDARLEDHIINSRLAQGEREVQRLTEEQIKEIVERWVLIKIQAAQDATLSHKRSLTTKFCPRCKKHHHVGGEGEGEDIGDGKAGSHHHEHDGGEAEQQIAPEAAERAMAAPEPVNADSDTVIAPTAVEAKPMKAVPAETETFKVPTTADVAPVEKKPAEIEPVKVTAAEIEPAKAAPTVMTSSVVV